jgi:peroxiredoxin
MLPADTCGRAQTGSAPEVKVGYLAPDFTLVDQNGKPHSLHEYRDKKNVALAFYIWAFSAD